VSKYVAFLVWLFTQSAEFLMMKNPLWLLLSVESLEGVLTLALCDMGPRAVINSAVSVENISCSF